MRKLKILSLMLFAFATTSVLFACAPTEPVVPNPPPSTPPYTPPVVVTPVKENITKYFSDSVNAEYLSSNVIVKDINGYDIVFEDLLSQQITILAKDIMYRLFAVYGEGSPAKSGVSSNLIDSNNRGHYYILTDEYDSSITYNGQNAYIHNNNILSNPSGYKLVDNTPEYKLKNGEIVKGANLDLNDIASYSYTYSTKGYKISYAEDALLNNYFNLSKSISGEKIWSENDLTFIINNQYPQLSWRFGYDNSLNGELAMYNNFLVNNYQLEKFEQAIANILMDNNSYYQYDKDSALPHINSSAFTASHKSKILQYVKDEIIGNNAINLDEDFRMGINPKDLSTITGDAHNYKAYNIIVPSIVEQAFSLTFENTNKSIYLMHNRIVNSTHTYKILTDGKITTQQNFTKLTLTPKSGTKPTKLVVKISGVASDKLNVLANITGVTTSNVSGIVSQSVGHEFTITFNFSSYNSTNLKTSNTLNLIFTNATSNSFYVTFDGYYSGV